MPTYPRETTEFVHVVVTVDGQPVTDGVAFSVVPRTTAKPRPTSWTPAVVIDGKTGWLLQPGEPGDLQVWARVTDNPEVPVLDCGIITRS
jgi:hypothetical protein